MTDRAEVPPASDAAPSGAALILAATILASSLAFIDGTVVTIALPAIQRSLDASFESLQWVVNAYNLMLGALILVGGGLGDLLGRRRIFIAGMAVFTAASLACAVAPSAAVLIAARAVQGAGAALLIPQSLAIITATFPRATRGRAIGTWAAASSVTTALGPVLGGFLIDWLSWRAAFWINLPLAAIAIALTLKAVPESRDPAATRRLDWAGSAIAVLALGAVSYGLTGFAEGLPTVLAGALILAGVVGIALFLWVEARAENPVMPPLLFRSRMFTLVNVVTVFLYGALAAALFLVPFDLIARRGLTAAEAGLTMMPIPIIIGLASRFTGALSDTMGPRPFLIAGPALFALSTAGLALGLTGYLTGAFLPLIGIACAMAIIVSPLTTAVMNAAPEGKSGAASGVNNAASRVAGLIAVAVAGTIASLVYRGAGGGAEARFGELPPAGDAARAGLEAAFGVAYSAAMWATAAAAALAAVAALLIRRGD